MTDRPDTLSCWEVNLLIVFTFFFYQYYKHKKGASMTRGQKLGYGVLSFLGAFGAVLILNVALFCIKVFIAAIGSE